ncbi:MAG: class F sortase [Quadrisphaera sp.]
MSSVQEPQRGSARRGRHAAPPPAASERAVGLLDAALRLPGRWGTTSPGSRAAAAAVCLGLAGVAVPAGIAALPQGPAGAPSERTALVAAAAASAAGSSSSSSTSDAAAAVPAPAVVPLSATAVAAPTAVRVPSLGISSDLVRLGTTADGALEVPADAAHAGWFAQGVAPGAVGPAVIAGHVDSRSGPGVFARLSQVAQGAQVEVQRSDGSTAVFVVTGVQQVPKDAFPTQAVYGPVAGPELRLITCGGVFDESTRHYVDNVVVYARLAQTTTS